MLLTKKSTQNYFFAPAIRPANGDTDTNTDINETDEKQKDMKDERKFQPK